MITPKQFKEMENGCKFYYCTLDETNFELSINPYSFDYVFGELSPAIKVDGERHKTFSCWFLGGDGRRLHPCDMDSYDHGEMCFLSKPAAFRHVLGLIRDKMRVLDKAVGIFENEAKALEGQQ